MTGLVGTGRVADDLYLIAHHEINGKPYVQPRTLGLGLAGGLVTELMLAGHISLWHEEVVAVGRAVPGEALTGACCVCWLVSVTACSIPVRGGRCRD